MRIAVVGAGALGTYLATRLAERHDLTLVVRSHQVELVRSRGLRTCIGRHEQRAQVDVVDHLAESPELLVLAVKTQDLAEACRSVQSLHPATTVATLQNGIRADDIVRSVLNPRDLIGVVAMCAATCLEPGLVQVDVPGWLIAGEEPAGPSRLHNVVDVFRQALPTFVTDNVVGARWMKLITNLNNGLSAATGLAWGELARDERGRRLSIRLMREGYAVARTCGIRLDRHPYGFDCGRLAPLTVVQGLLSTVLPDLPEAVANRLLWLVGALASRRLAFRGSTWQSIVLAEVAWCLVVLVIVPIDSKHSPDDPATTVHDDVAGEPGAQFLSIGQGAPYRCRRVLQHAFEAHHRARAIRHQACLRHAHVVGGLRVVVR